eukprot:CAMPEP_0206145328 /NCGR_PEP_ID=MMETSP1473-20131121/27037_1 /ASSEMBLY_ACC=CAM_ASM_001109 /TAXON_ID=1461547 /ORGANISM="Stichococcus sp, Strain RCC1054" /LENGTH=38 /DNA_ID= /DNA_START= /DNA_END= /DNA_ORIENTATION=
MSLLNHNGVFDRATFEAGLLAATSARLAHGLGATTLPG